MSYEHELIKDLILEKYADLRREDIVIENVHHMNGVSFLQIAQKEMILIDFYTTISKDVHGMRREFIKKQNLTFDMDEYEQRLTQRIRDNKLDDLGL